VTARVDIERLYRESGHAVLRRARELLRSDTEALDLCQELFVGLLAEPSQLDGVARPTAWLYRATTNQCLNELRKRKGRARILYNVARSDAVAPRAEHLATVHQLLARLPVELAEVAIYYFVDEMTHEEIAAMLGCSRRHIGDLVTRVREEAGDDARLEFLEQRS
jgi:RNA polymerase sigma factor (sigma-70 family)